MIYVDIVIEQPGILIERIKFFCEISDKELELFTTGVKESIVDNLQHSRTFTGEAVEPLKDSTVQRKGHHKVFFETGQLYRSIMSADIPEGKNIFVAPGRARIASWLHFGTDKMVDRPFFGVIRERAEYLLMTILRASRRI